MTDADPIHPETVHETMIQDLLTQVTNVTVDKNPSRDTIQRVRALMDADNGTITCAYKFHTGELNINSFLRDQKKDWYTEKAPCIWKWNKTRMKILQKSSTA